jgi:hypothetical protein
MIDSLNDFLHKHIGMHKYRPSINVRTDPFYEFLANEGKKDEEMLSRLSTELFTQQTQ